LDNKSSEDFVTGFSENISRPVDVIFDKEGSLFISDDQKGAVYKVIKSN
jgi:glucose/arabinose dehydrogenase